MPFAHRAQASGYRAESRGMTYSETQERIMGRQKQRDPRGKLPDEPAIAIVKPLKWLCQCLRYACPLQAGLPYALSPSKGKIQPDIKQARLGHGRGQVVRVADDIRPGHIKIEPAAPPAQPQGRARQVAARYAIAVFREHLTKIKRGIDLKRPQHPGPCLL